MITQNKTVCRREPSLKNASHCSVSNVSYIDNETMKQSKKYETTSETKYETRKNAIDIKALAIRFLEGREQKQTETVRETNCETRTKTNETPPKQKLNIEDMFYQFEERVAIMMFDGGLSETEATNQAFLEFLKNNF